MLRQIDDELKVILLLRLQRPGDTDQALGEIGVDAPVARGIGIGQRIASHRRANPEMIEFGALGAQAYFDVPKALPKGQLREGHAQKLIQAREGLHFELAPIAGDATAEGAQRKMLHQLREYATKELGQAGSNRSAEQTLPG